MINLVSNAIKFTHHGSVEVRAAIIPPQGDAPPQLVIEVQDTGIGIGPVELEQIFTPFEQADSSDSRAYGGTGLGLAICRQLAFIMKGQISVQSTPGVGSTFHVTLPI